MRPTQLFTLTPDPMKTLVYGLFAALLITVLAACDSGTDNPGGSTEGFTGDPDLLGMWAYVPTPGDDDEDHLQLSYAAATRTASYSYWESYSNAAGLCWNLDSGTATVTPTTLSIDDDPGAQRYTADRDNLRFYDDGETEPDVSYTRASRAASSFTPLCAPTRPAQSRTRQLSLPFGR